jgi:hypothetical protein
MRRTLPSQLFRPEHCGGSLGRAAGAQQSGVTAEFLRVLTAAPGCLEEFWSTIEPAFNAGIIQQAADEVRNTASLVIRDAVRLPDHLKWLDEQGYSREDNRQIRYVVETYYHTEPYQAVLAAVAYRWILGLCSSTLAVRTARADCCVAPKLQGVIRSVGEDEPLPCLSLIAERIGLPVHSFFRSLAVWPEYLTKTWTDLDLLRWGIMFPAMIADIKQSVDDASRRVPVLRDNPAFGLGLLDTARSIQQYMDTSCEIILYIAALRRMFIRSETLARNQRIKASLQKMSD